MLDLCQLDLFGAQDAPGNHTDVSSDRLDTVQVKQESYEYTLVKLMIVPVV